MLIWAKCIFLSLLVAFAEGRGVNGGFTCAACTIISGITDQLAEIYNETLLEASLRFCDMLPATVSPYCEDAVKTLEPVLINPHIMEYFTPDVFCYGIGLCYLDPGQTYCHLFPKPLLNFQEAVFHMKGHILETYAGKGLHPKQVKHHLKSRAFDFCKFPGIRELCEMFNKSWSLIRPAWDVDDDWFSVVSSARGAFWRGRDCHDWDENAYPGREPVYHDVTADYNCNGIWGTNPLTNEPWEKELCENSGSLGMVYIGDSVGAHFHFPEAWINPLLISRETLQNYTQPLLDELDWPNLGFATGFMNTTQPLLIKGITDSLYLRLRTQNRCNHRDYQNLSRNGASSFDGITYAESLARNQSRDKPSLVLFAMCGNDVCNNKADTLAYMTNVTAFRANILSVLEKLNTKLPHGSHVVLIGLVDGSVIYPEMANRVHPLGQLRQNIHYRDVYNWFTCMQMGPCNAWLNSNLTLRKLASIRAGDLSDVLSDVAANEKYETFTLHYLKNPLHKVIWDWKMEGKPVWKLIDPVDSLHPSQIAQPLLTQTLWNNLKEKIPEIIGKINPNNQRIQELFGDQGGH